MDHAKLPAFVKLNPIRDSLKLDGIYAILCKGKLVT